VSYILGTISYAGMLMVQKNSKRYPVIWDIITRKTEGIIFNLIAANDDEIFARCNQIDCNFD